MTLTEILLEEEKISNINHQDMFFLLVFPDQAALNDFDLFTDEKDEEDNNNEGCDNEQDA